MTQGKSQAPMHNQLWSKESLALLKVMFTDREPLPVMAQTLGRTCTSVVSKLNELKLIYYWNEDQCWYPYKTPYVFLRDLPGLDAQLKEIYNEQGKLG